MFVSAIYGLGNPGKEYEFTRHNAGFRVIDAFARSLGVDFRKDAALRGEFAKANFHGAGTLWLGKPLTFMNLSGECIGIHARYHKLDFAKVAVVYDDIALPIGAIKISQGGGDGGHNGIKSIVRSCGNAFIRFRIGIGAKPFREQPLADFVLGKLGDDEKNIFETQQANFIQGLELLVNRGLSAAQNLINKKEKNERP